MHVSRGLLASKRDSAIWRSLRPQGLNVATLQYTICEVGVYD
jgi:hypothetical protein